MVHGLDQQKAAVQSGYWPLFRYDPRLSAQGKNPFQLDSRPASIKLKDYVYNETRYTMLAKSNPSPVGAGAEGCAGPLEDLRKHGQHASRTGGKIMLDLSKTIDLTTTYLGLKLRNPLVASSSPMCADVGNIRRMEDAGAGAVVLHSLFEEQITVESNELDRFLSAGESVSAESTTQFPDMIGYNRGPENYLKHIAKVKAAVKIPVIASLNGTSVGGWLKYAVEMEQAGADALELNIYYIPVDPEVTGEQVERNYCDLVREVKSAIHIPVAVKLGPYFSAPVNMAKRLEAAGADGLVLFNRFYQPDFDLEALEVVPNLILSNQYELLLRLHWIAVLYGNIKPDLALTGGVHTATDVVKAMMAGAKVAMMTSALLKKGISYLDTMLTELLIWLGDHEYDSIRQMQGSMSRNAVPQPQAFERANYMKVLSSYAMQ
jgi:dihydroorotate dehydrogenase (fumarate)